MEKIILSHFSELVDFQRLFSILKVELESHYLTKNRKYLNLCEAKVFSRVPKECLMVKNSFEGLCFTEKGDIFNYECGFKHGFAIEKHGESRSLGYYKKDRRVGYRVSLSRKGRIECESITSDKKGKFSIFFHYADKRHKLFYNNEIKVKYDGNVGVISRYVEGHLFTPPGEDEFSYEILRSS